MKVIVSARIETMIDIPDPENIDDLDNYIEDQAYSYFSNFDYIDICDTFICAE